MHPSPAPKISRPRRWPWAVAGLGLGVVTLVGIVATYPRWADRIAAERIERTLERKLDTDVQIGGIELGYTKIVLTNVSLASPDTTLATVTVRLADNPLTSWRADVERVEIEGGGTTGSAEEFRALFDALGDAARTPGEGASWVRRRMRLMPRRLVVSGFDVHATRERGPLRALWAHARVEADPRERAADVRLEQVRAELAGGKSVTAGALETRVDASGPDALDGPFTFTVENGSTQITKRIAVGAVGGTVTLSDRAATSVRVDLDGGFADDEGRGESGLWSVQGEGRRDLSEGRVVLDMEPFALRRVPQVLAKLPVVDSEDATIAGRVELALGDGTIEVDGKLAVDGLNIEHAVLSKDVVRDVGFDARVRGTVEPEAHRVKLDELVVSRGAASIRVEGELEHPPERERRRYSLAVRVPPTDCQAVLGAIPADLIPSLQGFAVKGTYDAAIDVEVDYAKLEDLQLRTRVRPDRCKVRRVPVALDDRRLQRGFTHRVTMRDGRNRRVQLYPGSGSYTPLTAISPNMVAAVLTTEDGGFWRHRGFLPSQFETALRRNLREGKVALGASTITMQMVKNVFLSHERTISRKLQEMILTEYVERVLSKERIMELYLNVIEFGPGIYGVTAAANHYFGKHPSDLTSLEGAYLALMLPSPVRRHAHYCRGELTPRFDAKLRRIHKLMMTRNRIDEEEWYLWKDSPLQFDPLRVVNTRACLGEIEELLEAQAGQRALSGLLGDGAEDDFEVEAAAEPRRAPTALPDVAPDVADPGPADRREPDPANSDAPGVPAMERL